MSEERLEQIESKIAFLEQANAQLSDELLHQKSVLHRFQARIEQLASLIGMDEDAAPADERPPHY